jgi:phytoene synthase
MPPRPADATLPIDLVRRYDHDRFLASLFAPADRRASLWALLAFNLEIARVREVVSQPIIGQIRLQWWRDALEEIYTGKPPRRHEVVEPLAAAIEAHRLTRTHFDTLIDGREFDLADEPPASLDALERYVEKTSSRLIDLELEILGVTAPAAFEAARRAGLAWGLVGLVRAVPFHAAQGRILLPADLLDQAHVDRDALLAGRGSDGLAAVARWIVDQAEAHLSALARLRREIPRQAVPALLVARLSRLYLRRLARLGYDPLDPRLNAPDPLAVFRLLAARYFAVL